jgi:Protein of unknown function (DUF1588)/Protein of unknown function (DUF1592)/Protein of unknown function (DUF1595)/Protein of unknown function (DUF1585)/Protein of unknown function (DUF1587)
MVPAQGVVERLETGMTNESIGQPRRSSPPRLRLPPWALCLGLLGCRGTIGDWTNEEPTPGSSIGPETPVDTPPGAHGPAVGPSAGRRLTKSEYINTVGDLLGVALTTDDTSLLPQDQPATGSGFRNDILGLLPTAVRTDAYEALATLVSERVAWAGVLSAHATCTDATAACREGFIRHLGRVLYRRPLTDVDVHNLTPLFDLAKSDAAGFQEGARLVVQAMLQSPHFLYRLERTDSIDPISKKSGPSSFEVATRLSYLAWLSAPTPELLDAAEKGELSLDASYAAAVQRVIAGAAARRGFEGYAEDWLQLYRLDSRTPNEQRGVSQALLGEMKQETLRFASRIALTDNRALETLFTDKKTDLGPALSQVYGVTAPAQGFASYDLSSDPHRIGILTQPGFLILRAAPDRATIVHRGLMVLRLFLCSEVPAPPADAATKIDSIPQNLTDRDRFALHAASPTCKACHSTFDPLGHPFEPFDLAGKFRTQDEFGNVLRSDGVATLDGTPQAYENTVAFANLLSQSPGVHRCLVSKMFQYGLGRSLDDADESAIEDIAKQFESAGRTYVAAITSVATSPAFRAMAPVQ